MIIVHGNRIDVLVCAAVRALNNIFSSKEELSGTIDESLCHAI